MKFLFHPRESWIVPIAISTLAIIISIAAMLR